MRILFTSFMTQKRRPPFSADFDQVLVAALRNLGHTVDERRVRPQDDLSVYDRMFVQLWDMGSITSRYAAGCLWAMAHIPSVLFMGDHAIHSALRSFPAPGGNDPTKQVFRELIGGVARSDWRYWHLPPYAVPIVHAAESAYERPLLTQNFSFPGLDPSLLLSNGFKNLVTVDPSRLTPVPGYDGYRPKASERERTWLFAAMRAPKSMHIMEGTGWPIHRIGDAGQPLQSEADVTAAHLLHAATFARSYTHGGSGWWRLRYLTAVSTGTPIIVAKNEMPSCPFNELAPYEVEQLASSELDALASRQCEFFYRYAKSIEEFHDKLADVVASTPEPLKYSGTFVPSAEVLRRIREMVPEAPAYIRTDSAHTGGTLDLDTRDKWHRFLKTGEWS